MNVNSSRQDSRDAYTADAAADANDMMLTTLSELKTERKTTKQTISML